MTVIRTLYRCQQPRLGQLSKSTPMNKSAFVAQGLLDAGVDRPELGLAYTETNGNSCPAVASRHMAAVFGARH